MSVVEFTSAHPPYAAAVNDHSSFDDDDQPNEMKWNEIITDFSTLIRSSCVHFPR